MEGGSPVVPSDSTHVLHGGGGGVSPDFKQISAEQIDDPSIELDMARASRRVEEVIAPPKRCGEGGKRALLPETNDEVRRPCGDTVAIALPS